MKQLTLKKMQIKNFMGFKQQEFDFKHITNIYAENGVGKTTVLEAILWLLFDKNSEGNKALDWKPTDKDGNDMHNLETFVEASYVYTNSDGAESPLVFGKLRTEKYVQGEKSTDKIFDGHNTKFFINGTPTPPKKFEEYLKNIIDIETFSLLTDPLAFSKLHWKKQREILVEITGVVSITEIANTQDKFVSLRPKLINDKTIDDLLAENHFATVQVKKDIDNIPSRIDEVKLNILQNVEEPKALIVELQKELAVALEQNAEVNNDTQIKEISLRINNLKHELAQAEQLHNAEQTQICNTIEQEFSDSVAKQKRELTQTNESKNEVSSRMSKLQVKKTQLENDIQMLRAKHKKATEKQFVSNVIGACECCGRDFDSEHVAEKEATALATFNEGKAKFIADINTEGKETKAEIGEIDVSIKACELSLSELNEQSAKLEIEIREAEANKQVYNAIPFVKSNTKLEEISWLETKLEQLKTEITDSTDNSHVLELQDKLNNATMQVANHENAEKRVDQLLAEEAEVYNTIADLEAEKDLLKELIATQIAVVEEKISSMFKMTKFIMYNQLVNGKLEETCLAVNKLKGVKHRADNQASRMSIGIDIINTLNEYYQFQVPIFIDNRESITKIIDTNNQVVNLYVSENDKVIRVEGEQ